MNSQRNLHTDNYIKKRITHFLFNERGYNYIKLLKIIIDYLLNIPYEYSRILDNLIKPGSIVFDIGANMGQFACRFNKCVGKEGKVYSFEPVSFNFFALKKMKSFLKLKRVELYNKGVHFETGTTKIKFIAAE